MNSIMLIVKIIATIVGVFAFITLCRFSMWLHEAFDADWKVDLNDKFKIFWWRNK